MTRVKLFSVSVKRNEYCAEYLAANQIECWCETPAPSVFRPVIMLNKLERAGPHRLSYELIDENDVARFVMVCADFEHARDAILFKMIYHPDEPKSYPRRD